MPRPFQIFSQSDYLIQIVDINSHTELQTVQIQISWFIRSQLIWIYTVYKGRVYPGSAGQGLNTLTKHFNQCQLYFPQMQQWCKYNAFGCHTTSPIYSTIAPPNAPLEQVGGLWLPTFVAEDLVPVVQN